MLKFSKNLIANKESIICGWDIIRKKSLKYKTVIIPIDLNTFNFKFDENYKMSEIKNLYYCI